MKKGNPFTFGSPSNGVRKSATGFCRISFTICTGSLATKSLNLLKKLRLCFYLFLAAIFAAVLAFGEFSAKALFGEGYHPLLEFFGRDFVQYCEGKSLLLQQLCFFVWNSARTEIKEFIFIQRTIGRSVRTFHIIGINLKLGLRIYLGIFCKQKIMIFLICLCLLGIGPNVNKS